MALFCDGISKVCPNLHKQIILLSHPYSVVKQFLVTAEEEFQILKTCFIGKFQTELLISLLLRQFNHEEQVLIMCA